MCTLQSLRPFRTLLYLTGVGYLLSAGPALVWSQTTTGPQPNIEPLLPAVADADKVDEAPEAVPELARPFGLGVTYYLFSDFVFRGINFSEYAGEGREKLNHQMTTAIDVPLGKNGKFGTFGFDTFFEWFAGQEHLGSTPPGAHLQEIDFTLRYSYFVEPIQTKATVGWTEFTFPRTNAVHDRTNEWWFKLEHNDAWLWRGLGYKGTDGILNPSFFFAQDTGYILGQWYEISLNHPFTLCKNLTWTPKVTFAFDGGYIQRSINGGPGSRQFEYAYTQPGMELKYDLTELLHLPKWAGSVYISGQLYYNFVSDVEKDRNRASKTVLDDILFGGLTVGWTW